MFHQNLPCPMGMGPGNEERPQEKVYRAVDETGSLDSGGENL